MTYFVYKLTSKDDPDAIYIGVTTQPKKRLWMHRIDKRDTIKDHWIAEHRDTVKLDVICEYKEKSEALRKEKELIQEYKDSGAKILNTVYNLNPKEYTNFLKGENHPCYNKPRKDVSERNKRSDNPIHSKETQLKRIAASSKTYSVITPEGLEVEVNNLAEFCRIHGLNRQGMSNVVYGRSKHHKGYRATLR